VNHICHNSHLEKIHSLNNFFSKTKYSFPQLQLGWTFKVDRQSESLKVFNLSNLLWRELAFRPQFSILLVWVKWLSCRQLLCYVVLSIQHFSRRLSDFHPHPTIRLKSTAKIYCMTGRSKFNYYCQLICTTFGIEFKKKKKKISTFKFCTCLSNLYKLNQIHLLLQPSYIWNFTI
jgi:hypothetical protein